MKCRYKWSNGSIDSQKWPDHICSGFVICYLSSSHWTSSSEPCHAPIANFFCQQLRPSDCQIMNGIGQFNSRTRFPQTTHPGFDQNSENPIVTQTGNQVDPNQPSLMIRHWHNHGFGGRVSGQSLLETSPQLTRNATHSSPCVKCLHLIVDGANPFQFMFLLDCDSQTWARVMIPRFSSEFQIGPNDSLCEALFLTRKVPVGLRIPRHGTNCSESDQQSRSDINFDDLDNSDSSGRLQWRSWSCKERKNFETNNQDEHHLNEKVARLNENGGLFFRRKGRFFCAEILSETKEIWSCKVRCSGEEAHPLHCFVVRELLTGLRWRNGDWKERLIDSLKCWSG
jgi:hypothetical protein